MLVDNIVRLFVVCDWGGWFLWLCLRCLRKYFVGWWAVMVCVVSVPLLPDIIVRRGEE